MGTIAQIFESGAQSANKGLFNNLVMLARVDGEVDVTEVELLNRIAHRLALTPEQVNEILENPGNYPMIPPYSKEDRFDRYVQFLEMVCIDGIIDPKEEHLANKYGVALGIQEDQIDELESKIIQKIKEGISREDIVSSLL